MSALVTYEPYVDDCARIFCQRLDEMSKAVVALDMAHWFQCYAFDVIGEITLSERFGFLDSGMDIGGVIGALQGNAMYSTLVGIYSSLNPYLFPVMSKFRLGGAAGKAYLNAFIDQSVAKRKAEPAAFMKEQEAAIHQTEDGSRPQDFLSKWLAFHAEDPTRFTTLNVFVGMISNIGAGSDTTSTTLSGILYYLLKNPHTLAKLRDEISDFQRNSLVSSPITFKESQAMPYLQAVIKEAQRLHPALGLPMPRVVPEGGATICGTFFPQGVRLLLSPCGSVQLFTRTKLTTMAGIQTVVGINSWVAHRNSSIFGPDVDAFRPERWLVDDKEQLSAMDKYYMPVSVALCYWGSSLSFRYHNPTSNFPCQSSTGEAFHPYSPQSPSPALDNGFPT
jgi:cytochrome P450